MTQKSCHSANGSNANFSGERREMRNQNLQNRFA